VPLLRTPSKYITASSEAKSHAVSNECLQRHSLCCFGADHTPQDFHTYPASAVSGSSLSFSSSSSSSDWSDQHRRKSRGSGPVKTLATAPPLPKAGRWLAAVSPIAGGASLASSDSAVTVNGERYICIPVGVSPGCALQQAARLWWSGDAYLTLCGRPAPWESAANEARCGAGSPAMALGG
jgi:hypothetical protein